MLGWGSHSSGTSPVPHAELVSWALPLSVTNSAPRVVGVFSYLNHPKIREWYLILKSWQGWLVHRQFPQKGSPHLPAYCSPKLQSRLVRPEEAELRHVSTPEGMWKLFQRLGKLKDTCSLQFCK